jgi:hypothetical protein
MKKKTLSSPLSLKDLEGIARNLMHTAQGILQTGEALAPILFMFKDGTVRGAPLDMNHKDVMEVVIPAIIKENNPEAAFMITDAWKKDQTNTVRLGEIVTVFGICNAGSLICAAEYVRDENNYPVFKEIMVSYKALSRFFDGCFVDPFDNVSPTIH